MIATICVLAIYVHMGSTEITHFVAEQGRERDDKEDTDRNGPAARETGTSQ